jgi:hypothetical protein
LDLFDRIVADSTHFAVVKGRTNAAITADHRVYVVVVSENHPCTAANSNGGKCRLHQFLPDIGPEA